MSTQPSSQVPESHSRNVRDADLESLAIQRHPAQPARSGGGLFRWVGLIAVLSLLAAGCYWAVLGSKPKVEVGSLVRMPSSGATTLAATGYVVAQRQALIASKGTGRLEYLGVKVGDRVNEGQVIARLEHSDIDALVLQMKARIKVAQAQLGAAEPELQDATANYERAQALLEKSFVTKAEYDMAEARLRRARAAVRSAEAAVGAAEAELRAAEVQRENTNIRAPFDGIVVKKLAEVGEVVSPMTATVRSGGSVATIVDPTSVVVDAEVSESMVYRVQAGQPAEIQLDSVPGHRYRGEVVQVMPIADKTKATVLTRVRLLDLDERVRVELSAKVMFDTSSTSPRLGPDDWGVPATAVVTLDQRKVVLVVRNGVATEIPIQTGQTVGTLTHVHGQFSPTDEVIVMPPNDLRAGMAVSAVKLAL
ncbi:efflux RND transporter periplasmic adaptor subunit [Nitrospira sp. CMX1]